MEAEQRNVMALNLPLLLDGYQNHHLNGEEEEATSDQPTHGSTSFLKTCFNGLNALSGVGLLAIPYALSSGGWLSLILLLFIAMATFYTSILIKKCMDMNSDIKTYPDIAERAFGSKGKLAVSIAMYSELYLVATGLLILDGDNLNYIFPNIIIEIAGLFSVNGKQLFVILTGFIIILPSVYFNDLRILSYVSASGVFSSVIIICCLLWIAIVDGVGFHYSGNLIDWNGIPTAVSLYAFCYCAHPVFPILYDSYKNKSQFSNVLLVCFGLSTIGYALMAILGYLMFGSDVESEITLNLPINKLSSKVAICITVLNALSKYALVVTPIKNGLNELVPQTCSNKRLTNLLISMALVMSSIIVAIAVPFFGYLMSLVGAVLSITGSILLPCLCYLKISGKYSSFCFGTIVIEGIIFMGVLLAIFGTYTSLLQIIENL